MCLAYGTFNTKGWPMKKQDKQTVNHWNDPLELLFYSIYMTNFLDDD